MKRCEIEEKYKWDLTDLCRDWSEYKSIIEELSPLIDELLKYKGHLFDSAENLYNYFKDSQIVEEKIERLELYVHLVIRADNTDQEAIKNNYQIMNIISSYNSTFSFVVPEILNHDLKEIEEMMKCFEPLREFKFMFEEMFRLKSFTLDEKTESIISSIEPIIMNFSLSSQFIRNKEMKYKPITLDDGTEIKLNASNINKYALSESRSVRRQAFESSEEAVANHIDSLASNLIGYVEYSEMLAKLKGFESGIKHKFTELGIDYKVYETLKSNLKKHKKSYKKYVDLYKKVLNIKDFHSYDLNAPLVSSNKEYTVEEAKDIILNTFSFFGEEYSKVLNKAFSDRCIDFLPSDEKNTGWSSSYTPYHTPRVFANYYNKILDISSLSHELGHFCNQYMTINNQKPEYVYSSSFLSEIASLNNEFVFSHIYREKCDDLDTKLQLLGNFIKIFASNFFGSGRQAMFEESMHNAINNNESLSSSVLCELWNKADEDVMGNIIPHSSNTWAIIPHFFYENGYYVFSYATATIAACNLCYKLINHEEGIFDKFYEFLKSGGSKSPMEILESLGIDLTDNKTFDIALKMFDDAIDEYIKIDNSR